MLFPFYHLLTFTFALSFQPTATAALNSDMIAARIAENTLQRSQVKANTEKSQILDDEMFALYLQNEEFLNDLREDEDFMRTLERGKRLDLGMRYNALGIRINKLVSGNYV